MDRYGNYYNISDEHIYRKTTTICWIITKWCNSNYDI